jgi:hypothetical protein
MFALLEEKQKGHFEAEKLALAEEAASGNILQEQARGPLGDSESATANWIPKARARNRVGPAPGPTPGPTPGPAKAQKKMYWLQI